MESSGHKRRFPPPWIVHRTQHGFEVRDANGVVLASSFCRDDLHHIKFDNYTKHLTSDEARKIAKAISRLPELLRPLQGFPPREAGKRWRKEKPYHVAIENSYLQARWFEMDALCKYNSIPFDATGEKMEDGVLVWCLYEFASVNDAVMFWRQFEGRWIRLYEFHYPVLTIDAPEMKLPPGWKEMTTRDLR